MKRKLALLAVIFAFASHALAADKKDLSFQAPDGVTLKASYYSPGKPGPGIMLFHQCNKDRKSWDDLALQLAAAGFHVFTYDLRGFGDSAGEKYEWPGDLNKAMPAWHDKWGPDMDAAYQLFLSQPGVSRETMGVGGASCGVYMALLLAQRHPQQVKALVLLSGFTDQAGKDYLSNTKDAPVLGAASYEDKLAADSIHELIGLSQNRSSELILFWGGGHGTAIFEQKPPFLPFVANWFKEKLTAAH